VQQQQQQLLRNLRSCKTHAFEQCNKKQVEEEQEEQEEEQESSPNLSLQLNCRASNRPRSK
jgi:hypothetical protein